MGLLDELLGGLVRSGLGQPASQSAGRPASQTGGAMGGVLMALLPVVLSMLASRPPGAGSAGAVPGGAGGAGGLGDLLDQFRRQGFGTQADSWVGRGANLPVSPDVISQVFGKERMAQIAAEAGVSEEEASAGLSQVLPEVVDRVTPEGRLPDLDGLTGSVDALQRRLGR
jgi:uncharacterized protein YidB (DUF937 family)